MGHEEFWARVHSNPETDWASALFAAGLTAAWLLALGVAIATGFFI